MKTLNRGLLIIFISLLTLAGCKNAPQKPLTAESKSPLSLSNTKWHYMDSDWEYDIEFLSDGSILTNKPIDDGYVRVKKGVDHWEQKGENIILKFSDGYSTYEGKFIGQDIISGTAKNKKNIKWKWKVVRIKK